MSTIQAGTNFSLYSLFKRDGEVQDCLHEVHKRGIAVRNFGHLVRKLPQINLFCLADCNVLVSRNGTNLDVLMKLTQVALHVKPLHYL